MKAHGGSGEERENFVTDKQTHTVQNENRETPASTLFQLHPSGAGALFNKKTLKKRYIDINDWYYSCLTIWSFVVGKVIIYGGKVTYSPSHEGE